MLGKEKIRHLCDDVIQRVGEAAAEVFIFTVDESLTRFANNGIHQNVSESNMYINLRMFLDSREGTSSTNRSDSAALDEMVARAQANARVSPENPDFPGLRGSGEYAHVQSFDEITAECSPGERAQVVRSVCSLAGARGLDAYGAFTTGVVEIALANTQGLYAYHMATSADFQTVIMEPEGDASGWAQTSGWRVGDLPVGSIGVEAVNKAEMGRQPQPLEPGEYCVILDPYATQDILMMLNMTGMGANTVQEGRSWMIGRIDKQVLSPTVSIWDDASDPNGIPIPFDFEGTPKQRVDIVRHGVVLGPVYDRTTAKKAGRESTGHGLPPEARAYSPLALNLFMAPGDSTVQDMIQSTEKGLYVTRFHYTRPVHPADCVITGMTRDGAYWIEDGVIQHPVKNLRFTQSYVKALAEVEAIGSETRLLNYTGTLAPRATRVPALKLRRFNFTGATE